MNAPKHELDFIVECAACGHVMSYSVKLAPEHIKTPIKVYPCAQCERETAKDAHAEGVWKEREQQERSYY